MKKRVSTLILMIICFVSMHKLFAQNDSSTINNMYEMSLEDLLNVKINIASNTGKDNIFSTPSTVTIVDRKTIESYNFLTIQEALQTVGGFTVMRSYLKRNLPTSRGITQDNYANKVLILINGVPAWNAVTGEGNLERIDINDVERIEVLKGPASVLFGTNAYSGAINIVLREDSENKPYMHAGAGAYNSYNTGGGISYKKDDLSLFVSGNSLSLNGGRQRFRGEDGVVTYFNEQLQNNNFTLSTEYKGHRILINSFDGNESHFGVTPTVSAGAGNDHNIRGTIVNYNLNKDLSEKITIRGGGYYDWQYRELSRSKEDVTRSKIDGYRVTGLAGVLYKITSNLSAEAGIEYNYRFSTLYQNFNDQTDTAVKTSWSSKVNNVTYKKLLDGNNNMKNIDQYEYSGFLQANYKYKKFNLVAGSRYTSNELFGKNVSSRGTLVYTLNEKNSFKLIYGESYRSPALFEQYFVFTTVLGNPNLLPEKSKSLEIAYLTSFKNLFVQVLGYKGIYENKITRQKGNYTFDDGFPVQNISIYQNGGTFSAYGAEAELRYSNPKIIDLFVNYGFVEGDRGDEDTSGHYNFKYVPNHDLTAGISKNFLKHFSISALINYWSEVKGPYSNIANQKNIDLSISYNHKLSDIKVSHCLSFKNILDEDLQVPEYVRINKASSYDLNEIPMGYPFFVNYTIKFRL